VVGMSYSPNEQDIDDIGHLLTRVADVGITSRQAEKLIEEMS
jgi:hypothetical protein